MGNKHEIIAVENNSEIAKIYQDFFPNDKVIVADAHQFLLEHYKEFDFIWSSPPCPSHSNFRFMTTKMEQEGQKRPIIYPDMGLYQEIILLNHYFKGKWIVENVKGYYEPLIKPQEVGRHYFWANFIIEGLKIQRNDFIKKHHNALSVTTKFDLSKYKIEHRKDTILRNCVLPELGLNIFDSAFKTKQNTVGDFLSPKGESLIAVSQN